VFSQIGVADLDFALPVNVEQHVVSGIDRCAHRICGCAIEIPEYMGVLQHPPISDGLFEAVLAHEMVFAPVLLSGAWRAGGGRDRELQPGVPVHQTPRQG
jgi:hypothetical protein